MGLSTSAKPFIMPIQRILNHKVKIHPMEILHRHLRRWKMSLLIQTLMIWVISQIHQTSLAIRDKGLKKMPFQINIFNIKTNSVANNANISLGPSVQNSHTANQKWVGSNFSLGDLSPSSSFSLNGVGDTDISDQDQIANPSSPIANQF